MYENSYKGFVVRNSLTKKIVIPLIIGIFLAISLALFEYFQTSKEIERSVLQQESHYFTHKVESLLRAKTNTWITNALLLSINQEIIESLATNDNTKLRRYFSGIGKLYRQYTPFKKVNIHIVTKDLVSFFKSWAPDKYGEKVDFDSYRHMLKIRRPFTTLEADPKGLRLRSLAPVRKDGEFLGFVDFSGGLNNFEKEFKKEHIYFLYFLDKKYGSIVTKPLLKKEGYVLSSTKHIDKAFLDFVLSPQFSLEQAVHAPFILTDRYFIKAIPLKDYAKRVVGYALLGMDTQRLLATVKQSQTTTLKTIVVLSVAFLVLVIVLLVIIKKAVLDPIDTLRRKAEELSSSEGDLTKVIDIRSRDEIGKTAEAFNNFIQKVRKTVEASKVTSQESKESADKLYNFSMTLQEHIKQNLDLFQDADEALKMIESQSKSSKELAKTTNEKIVFTKENLQKSVEAIEMLTKQVQLNAQKEGEYAQKMQNL